MSLLSESGSRAYRLYQVLNEGGYPAGVELTNPSALFTSREDAEEYIDYLVDDLGVAEAHELTITELNAESL